MALRDAGADVVVTYLTQVQVAVKTPLLRGPWRMAALQPGARGYP